MQNYKTARSFDELAQNPAPEYRLQQRTQVEQLFNTFITKRKDDQSYLQSPEKLKEALDDYEKLQGGYGLGSGSDFGVIGAESFYFRLKKTLNSSDESLTSASNQADEFATKMQNEILFFELSLSAITPSKQSELLASPLLVDYHHFLQKRFEESKYLLPPAWEKVLNVLTKTSYYNRDEMLDKMLSKQEAIDPKTWETIPFELLLQRCSDLDLEKRKRAADQVNSILSTHAEIAENEINSILEYKKEVDKLRNFSYPEQATYLRDDISPEVVETMVQQVSDSNEFSQSFYQLKAKLLWLQTLTYEEKNLPYGEVDKEYSFDEAVSIVHETLNEIDSEFWSIFSDFLQKGRVDVFPQKWKRGGAFCTDGPKNLPIYIMLNHTNKIRDVSTLIHEFGHGINAVLNQKQNALNYGALISTAEVASTFFENVLIRKLQGSLSGEELLAYRMSVLDTMVQTVHRQVAGFRFEQELHTTFRQQGYLSFQKIWELFKKHMSNYMGDIATFWPGSENRWIYRGHFRRFFYVYSYASGFLIAKSMESMLHQEKMSIQQLKDFLSAGTSDSPENTFKNLWIDIKKSEFRREGINEMKTYLQETIELAKSLGKI